MKDYYVYVLASKRRGTLYVGLTSDLKKRVWEHKTKVVKGFTAQYDVTTLVYFEVFNSIELAQRRERRLKRWYRTWKIELVETHNPDWIDLYPTL